MTSSPNPAQRNGPVSFEQHCPQFDLVFPSPPYATGTIKNKQSHINGFIAWLKAKKRMGEQKTFHKWVKKKARHQNGPTELVWLLRDWGMDIA